MFFEIKLSESAVNNAAIRINDQIKWQKHLKMKIDKIADSTFKV